jgi:hypothetical protein
MAYQVLINNDQINITSLDTLTTKQDVLKVVSTLLVNRKDIPLSDYRIKRLSDGKITKIFWKK